MKHAGHLELLGGAQIKAFRPQVLAADPDTSTLLEGIGWWNTTEKALKFYNGVAVITLAQGGSLADYVKHDGSVAMTGDLVLSSADQSAAADNVAVSKGYVAGLLAQKQATVTGAASSVVTDNLAPSVVTVTDESGKLAASAVTAVELGYLTGVTSSVQTQLDGKQAALGFTPLNKAGDSLGGDIAAQGHVITGLGAPVQPTDAARKIDIEQALAGINWQQDVAGIQVDDTLVPELLAGKRYIITDTTKLNAAFGAIVGLGNNDVVEYNVEASAFAIAFDASADDADGALAWNAATEQYVRLVNGVWGSFGGLSNINAGVGLGTDGGILHVLLGAGIAQLPTNEVGVDLHTQSGLALLDEEGNESTDTNAQLAVKLDGTTLARSATGLKVADGGVAATQLAASVAGNGLTGGAGTALAVVAKAAGALTVDAQGIAVDKVALAQDFVGVTGATAADLKVTAAPVAATDVVRLSDLQASEATASGAAAAVNTRINASEVQYDGSANVVSTHTVTHNLNNSMPQVEVMDSTGETVIPDSITRPDANTVVVSVTPAQGIKVVVRGNKNA